MKKIKWFTVFLFAVFDLIAITIGLIKLWFPLPFIVPALAIAAFLLLRNLKWFYELTLHRKD
jgi:hypothetical protein